MFYNNIKQIIRSLWSHKSFTFINLLGLSIGIAAVAIIFLIVHYEKSFDQFHSESNGIYRIVSERERSGIINHHATVPYPTAELLRAEYPGILATQIHFSKDMDVRIEGEDPFKEKNIIFADSLFFEVLDFKKMDDFWQIGNPATALHNPHQVVITENTAQRYFGKANPIGKILNLENKYQVEVTGIIKDVSRLNHLPVSMIVSFATLEQKTPSGLDMNNWNFTATGYSYVRFKDGITPDDTRRALQSIVQRNANSESSRKALMKLQPLSDIHFELSYENDNPSYTISTTYLNMLVLLGGFIIMIACVNYINLATSFAFNKSKEVGIRKSIGASKGQLFSFYLLETLIVTICATAIGLLIAVFFLPEINQILDKSITASPLLSMSFIVGVLITILIITFISGFYPAMILAGFNPITALTNKLAMPGKSSVLLRKSLVVFQFSISTALIICTLIIARQMEYFQNKSLGFNKEAVVEVVLPERDSTKRESFRTLLQSQSSVKALSFCLGAPISTNGLGTSLSAQELPEELGHEVKVITCDRSYVETYELEILAGRWFLSSEEQNIGTAVVVNRTLAKTLGYSDPEDALGKWIQIGLNDIKPTIVGVTEDFHTSSLHNNIGSVALTPFPYFHVAAGIRLNPGNIKDALEEIKIAWKKVYPESVYEVNFIDDTLAAKYEQEIRDYQLFKIFSVISIFICCMGLWGLITFVVVRKTREIGIRKVLGASISGIVILISRDFLKLVFIALVISSSIASYFMQKWLANFAYPVEVGWWIFALAGLFSILIAFLAISYPAIKAALANPVKNLRID